MNSFEKLIVALMAHLNLDYLAKLIGSEGIAHNGIAGRELPLVGGPLHGENVSKNGKDLDFGIRKKVL